MSGPARAVEEGTLSYKAGTQVLTPVHSWFPRVGALEDTMNTTKQKAADPKQDDAAAQPVEGQDPSLPDTQPPPSGTGTAAANRGSPAASVMKQSAKTKAESTGRP